MDIQFIRVYLDVYREIDLSCTQLGGLQGLRPSKTRSGQPSSAQAATLLAPTRAGGEMWGGEACPNPSLVLQNHPYIEINSNDSVKCMRCFALKEGKVEFQGRKVHVRTA